MQNVAKQIISPEVEKLSGKQRVDAIEKNSKLLIAACEKEVGFRCRVATFYGGMEYQLIKSLEVRDIRQLVGLAFDGTYDTIIPDWDFNPVTTRSIQVDLRYMLWQMKVDHADNLLKEMHVK